MLPSSVVCACALSLSSFPLLPPSPFPFPSHCLLWFLSRLGKAIITNIIVPQVIMCANCYPHNNSFNNGHWQACTYLCSQCLVSTFEYLFVMQLFNSVSSRPYREIIFCWYKSVTVRGACTLWMSLQLWRKSSRSFHSNSWKAVLVLSSWRLTATFSLSALLLQHLLDHFRHWF